MLGWQGAFDVGECLALALDRARLDLHHQNVARPVLLDGLAGVPPSLLGSLEFVEQGELVVPRQSCKHPLHKCLLRPRLGKGPHVLQVARREPLHVGEGQSQVVRQSVNDLGTPAEFGLPVEDVSSDSPVKQHQLGVGRQRGPLLSSVDPTLEVSDHHRPAPSAQATSEVGMTRQRGGPKSGAI